MEEFRPLVDRVGQTLVNRSQIGDADFAAHDGGGVTLSESVRKAVRGGRGLKQTEPTHDRVDIAQRPPFAGTGSADHPV